MEYGRTAKVRFIGALSLVLLVAETTFGAYKHQSTLTVGGYAGETSLADFPLLVRVPAAVAAKCQADGKDIAFGSDDGATTYPHEIDEWNSSGESLVWVKLPVLTKGTVLVMKFGDEAATVSSADAAKVWAGYTGVYHMNETANQGTTDFTAVDSSPLGLDLTAGGKNANRITDMISVSGAVGRGRQHSTVMDWSNANYLKNTSTEKYDSLGEKFVASGWFYFLTRSNSHYLMGRKGARNTTDGGWLVDTSDSGLRLHGSTTYQDFNANSVGQVQGGWSYDVIVFNGTTAKVYVNGSLKTTGTLKSAPKACMKAFSVGCNETGGTASLKGSYDEIRLKGFTDAEPSAERIAAEYANMTAADYVTFGPIEDLAAGNTLIVGADVDYPQLTFTPACGESAVTAGEISCTATAGKVNVAVGQRAWVTGWELTVVGADGVKTVTSGEGTTCAFVHAEGAGDALVWKTACEYEIVATSSDPAKGTVTGGGWFASGATVTLTATTKGDFYFSGWTGDVGEADPAAKTIVVTADAAKTLVANFIDRPIITVTASSAEETMGSVSGGGQVPLGDDMRVIARAKDGYVFDRWTGTNVPAGFETSYYLEVPVTEAMNLVATFIPKGEAYTFVPVTKSGSAYSWTEPTNWQGRSVPPNDGTANVVIDASAAFTMSFAGVQNVRSLTFVGAGKMTQETWNGRGVIVGAGGITVAEGAARPKFYSNSCLKLSASQKWTLRGTSDFSVSDLVGDESIVVEIVGPANVSVTKSNFKGRVVTTSGQAPVLAGKGFDLYAAAYNEEDPFDAGARTVTLDVPNGDWNPGARHGTTISTPLNLALAGSENVNVSLNTYDYSVTNIYRFTGSVKGEMPMGANYLNFYYSLTASQQPTVSRLVFDGDASAFVGNNARVSLTGVAIELAHQDALFAGSDIAGFDLGGCLAYRLTRNNWGVGRGNLSAVYLGDGVTVPGEIHLNPYRQWTSNGKADGQIGMLSSGEATFSGKIVCTNGYSASAKANVGVGEMQVYAAVGAKVNLTGDVLGSTDGRLRVLGGGEVVFAGDNAAMGGLDIQAGRVQLAADTAAGAGVIGLGVTCPEVIEAKAFAPMTDAIAFKTTGNSVTRAFGGVTLESGDTVISGRSPGVYTFGGGTTRTLKSTPEGNARARIASGDAFGGKSVFRYAVDNCTYWLLESETLDPEVAVLARDGVTIANPINVADNKSAGASTIGSADASAVTFAGDITLAKDVVFAAAAGSTVNVMGAIINEGGYGIGFAGLGTVRFSKGLDVTGQTIKVTIPADQVPSEGVLKVTLAQGLTGQAAGVTAVTADGSAVPAKWVVRQSGSRLVFRNRVSGCVILVR